MKFFKSKKSERREFTSFDDLIKVRGDGRARNLNSAEQVDTRTTRHRNFVPRGINREMAGAYGSGHSGGNFSYDGKNRGDFYRWLREKIPMLQTGISVWVSLCATRMKQIVKGSFLNRERALQLLFNLDNRILEIPFGRGSGLQKLTRAYFLELFTVGKFAGEAVLSTDEKSIDHFRYIDPYLVSWEHTDKGWVPLVYNEETSHREEINPEYFFYGCLSTDLTNPLGCEPLASIPFVVEVEQLMLEDMARSSHNTGHPRMQVKITRPEQFNWEEEADYANRVNSYFNGIVTEFKHLEPDDNIFSWSDVEVTVIGQNGSGQNWRLGREQVIEDVITGLKLFPWVLGRSHKTTQNWVQSQFDLLMEMVASYQNMGSDLVDWLCNLELKLQGVDANVYHLFDDHPDPFRKEKVLSRKVELENINFKVEKGYISKDEGAQEMGYEKAFQQDEVS